MSGQAAPLGLRTWIDVDLGAVGRNFDRVRELRPNRDVIAVLKADAYGHGAVEVAREVERRGAKMIGIGDSSEALELVRAGLRAPLLILGAIVDGEMEAVVANDVRTTIHSSSRVARLADEARRQGRVHKVHLKVDSGLSRLGVLPSLAVDVALAVAARPELELEGLSTHLLNSHLDRFETSNRQIETFRQVHTDVAAALGRPIACVHAMNSAASWNRNIVDDFTNTVRVGAALYGIPGPVDGDVPFEPAMTLQTQILFLKDVPEGSTVGYDARFVTERRTRLAVLPCGYHDGLPTTLFGRGAVLVRGRRAPIVGAISMDYVTIDVTDVPDCSTGDRVLIFGSSEQGTIPLPELAAAAGISNYAVTCGLGRRVRRLYHDLSAVASQPSCTTASAD